MAFFSLLANTNLTDVSDKYEKDSVNLYGSSGEAILSESTHALVAKKISVDG